MKDYQPFLDSFFEQIDKSGIDVSTYKLDHFAYQASSPQDYDDIKAELLLMGELASEMVIGERRVAVIKLNTPIHYKEHIIDALEVVEPKAGQVCDSMWQHAEFITPETFESYMEKYPEVNWDTSSLNRDEFSHLKLNFDNGLTLKFLHSPILELVKKD